jgi:hypothetical protein
MATASPTSLPPINHNTNFSITVNLVPDPMEMITGISASLVGSPVEPITFTVSGTSVIITGKHQNLFKDVFTFTPTDTSDKTAAAISVAGIGAVPDKQNLFDLKQDQRQSVVRTYQIDYSGGSVSVTQEVLNPLEVILAFMKDYNYNDYKNKGA